MSEPKIISALDNVQYRTEIVGDGRGKYTVWPYVTNVNVDRPQGVGYGGLSLTLARRMAVAIKAGAVFYDHTLRVDVNGNTYVNASTRVLGRTANADLKRLGY